MKFRKEISVGVIPVGEVTESFLRRLSKGLENIFKARFELKKPLSLPKEAYNPLRRQYHSTKILNRLVEAIPIVKVDKVLGVTPVDLYVPRLNFVFGEALCPGEAALISLFRLNPGLYGEPDGERFLKRALKEAVHELGHTFGLHHCSNPKCVMFFSNSLLDTDRKEEKFCLECERKLKEPLVID
ncbi:TPA: hypothetical protein EYP26_06115 [Candidatus Bathyarchaeota archaeon]|nr:hypothetical protein [Candidatus Bathyarchaeota archaeon]